MNMMLDEIKKRRPTATVRGTIWEIVGNLSDKFQDDLKAFRAETQDVMLYQIETELKKEKPEMRALAGLFKSMALCLNRCVLEDD